MGTNSQPDLETNVPIPDPSTLTTAALLREIEHLRELMEGRLDAQKASADEVSLRAQQRFDAQTKALDAALLAQQTAVQAAMMASEKAISKAEIAAEKRFDALMEAQRGFHNLLAETMPRREAETRIEALAIKIDDLKSYASTAQGRDTGASSSWAFLAGGIGLLAAIVSVVITAINFANR